MTPVLVVCEEALARRVAWVLEDSGYLAEPVSDASAALKRAQALSPEAIIVNSVLPPEQMPKFTLQLRAVAPDASIIDVTGKPAEPSHVPAEEHLTQPFDADDLIGALNRVIETDT